ncbi:helix-turn-helix domain-containing protein [Megalodesulfovibrio paquesii]
MSGQCCQAVLQHLASVPGVAGCATTAEVHAAVGYAANSVRRALRTLRERGLVTSLEGLHELTAKGRAWIDAGLEITSGPRPGQAQSRHAQTLRAKAWRALRLKGKCSLDDLLMLVADGTEKDAEKQLRRYCRALEAAGYLVPMRSGWLLPADRNTGPEAPAYNSKTRTVTDPNTGDVWPLPRN